MAVATDTEADARRGTGEAGEITSTTLIFPVVLFMVLVSVQFALGYHAKAVLAAAAQDAARAAQVGDARPGDGERVATAFVTDNARTLLEHVSIDITRDADHVHVRLGGDVTSVVPGVHLRVHAAADGPRERFRAPDER
jgi:Flp pilus assembly protein TadG